MSVLPASVISEGTVIDKAGARHRKSDPDDLAHLNGQWHVSLAREGDFPADEAKCPCPKAVCGLAAPVGDIPCDKHHGEQTVAQVHAAKDCKPTKRIRDWFRAGRSSGLPGT